MALESIDELLNQSMGLSLEAVATQHMVHQKVNFLRREISKVVQEAMASKNQLSATNAWIIELEQQEKSSEELIAWIWKELKDARASRVFDLAKFTEEIKTKENEALEKEADAYVQAHSDLLIELIKYYPKQDFTQLKKLTPGVEAESESQPEGDDINNVTDEQDREDPSME